MVTELRSTVLEVRRKGRRPRYHRGASSPGGPGLRAEQCNLDQTALGVVELEALPLRVRPNQLCRRCFPGGA